MDELEWMEMREESCKYLKEKHESPLIQYLTELNISDDFLYEYSNMNRNLVIYTKRPGIWIGLHGSGYNRLKEILLEKFEHDVEVNFKEVRGDFISFKVTKED